MAIVSLTRNALMPYGSNTAEPGQKEYRFYEVTYTATGVQDWIKIPDFDGVSVTLSPSASTASIEVTDSPPDIIDAGTAAAVTWSPGVVSVATTATLQGFSAFRVNVATGASVKISARC